MSKFITKTATLLVALVALGGVVTTNVVRAEEQKSEEQKTTQQEAVAPQISPVSQRVILRPNEVSDHKFTMTNNGNKPFSFTVYAMPYGVSGEDYSADFATESQRTQVSRWISFKKPDGSFAERVEYSLEGGSKMEIGYKVSTPADLPAGGQYAIIMAEIAAKDVLPDAGGVRAVPRLSLKVFGRSEGDTKFDSEILEYNVPGILIDRELKVSALVKNSGNTDIDAIQDFKVSTLFGKVLHEEKRGLPVFPEKPRRFELAFPQKPLFQIYKVDYSIKAHDKNYKRTTIVLSMSSIVTILLFIVLTFGVTWLIMVIKQRKERDSRQLV